MHGGAPYDSDMATDSTTIPLAEGFEHDVSEWEKAAADVLRKARKLDADADDDGVWGALSTVTLDGITVPPLGIPSASAPFAHNELPGQAPYTRGATAARPDNQWDIRAKFADSDNDRTREHITTDLENGVNSLWLAVGDDAIATTDLARLLDPVFLDLAPVVLDAPHTPLAAATTITDILHDRGLQAAEGTNLGADPVGAAMRDYGDSNLQTAVDVAKLAVTAQTRGIVVDGTAVHDAGGTDVQELAYSLAAGVAYLRALTDAGFDADTAAGLLDFRYAVTNEQFTTIAKLRAARRAWHRVCELSGVSGHAGAQIQHAVTSRPMMTRYDSMVNLLRTTVAAMAAGVGGASSITVLPFDDALGLPEPFSRRTARNIGSMLIAESHIGVVTDPAGGSHMVEQLTDDIAHAAWQEFGRIEESGGIGHAIADGSLSLRIAESAEARAEQIATRRMPLTGISEFPDLDEELPQRRPAPGPAVQRYGEPFERLRDRPATEPVFLATMGPIAAHTARASFAANVFAAGGVRTVSAEATDGVDAVIARWKSSGVSVACLCGTDETYEQWGAQLIEALRAHGATRVIIAGKTELDVDDAVYVGAHILAFLHRTRHELEAHA